MFSSFIFNVVVQPSIPDILAPVYGDTIVNPALISWSKAAHTSGIDRYELEIDGQITSETIRGKAIELTEGPHKIRVRAVNGLNIEGGFSEEVVFTVIEE